MVYFFKGFTLKNLSNIPEQIKYIQNVLNKQLPIVINIAFHPAL